MDGSVLNAINTLPAPGLEGRERLYLEEKTLLGGVAQCRDR
jgi:hypothetical protein